MLGTDCYDSFELALLDSTRQDIPPPHALRRTAAALGVALPAAGLQLLGGASASSGVAATAGQATGASSTIGAAVTLAQPVASKVTLAMVIKHVGVGLVAGTVTVGGAQGAYHVMSSPQSRPVADIELMAPLPGSEHVSASAPKRVAHPLESTSEPVRADEPQTPRSDRSRADAARKAYAEDVGPSDAEIEHSSTEGDEPGDDGAGALAAEVDPDSVAAFALPSAEKPADPPAAERVREEPQGPVLERSFLARARAAIGRRDPAAALRQLDAHAARFPRGKLKGQANLLRVEALLLAERREEALSVGRREILRAPSRQKVKRIRELFDRKPEP